MSHSDLARRAKYRAIFFGTLMSIIVFGGAIVYFMRERPALYRGEGGDYWVFAHYEANTDRETLSVLRHTLSETPGSWGAELIQEPNGSWILLSRWGNQALWEKQRPTAILQKTTGFVEIREGTIQER